MGDDEKLLSQLCQWLYSSVNVWISELSTINGYIVWYVKFMSTKLLFKKGGKEIKELRMVGLWLEYRSDHLYFFITVLALLDTSSKIYLLLLKGESKHQC